MEWRRTYVLKSYLRSSMWVVPLAAYATFFVLIRAVGRLDEWAGWSWQWHLDVNVVQTVLQGLSAATMSFIVFTFSSLLVALQVASAQLTPRIIATTLLRDNTIRTIVALFVFTLSFDLGVVARTDVTVPYLLVTVALVVSATSIAAFLYLIDYAARLLRPITIVWRLGEEGIAVIRSVYPSEIKHPHVATPPLPALGTPARVVDHDGSSAIVLAVNPAMMKAEAERTNGVIEFAARVGDFVASGEPLFRLHGGAQAADAAKLRASVAMGRERTIEQDATFAFRIIVDIAIKALSRAINDPTTAVLAIDQLHRLLRVVGRQHLHDDALRDVAGKVCVVFRTPNWDDFVWLSCREIRLYGAENYQVARRLRAMLQNLLHTLPEARHPALREELNLLDATLDRLNMLPGDLALAAVSDLQGLGASVRQ
jgi:uncharacterized membrane protein